MNDLWNATSDGRLAHGLLSDVAAVVFSGTLDAQVTEMLRETFRKRMPGVDVSDDLELGRAIEDLALRFRVQGQGF